MKSAKVKQSKIISIVTSGGIAFLLLFVLGNLGAIKSIDSLANPTLILLQAFIFVTMSFFIYYLIFQLFVQKKMLVIVAIIISAILAFLTISADPYGTSYSYTSIGNYLRDAHKINIYYMDWAGFSVVSILYLTSLYSVLMSQVIKRFKL